jgi:hypothetical protein
MVDLAKTPKDVCTRYIQLEDTVKTLVNKKRKDAEREMQKLMDEYRSLTTDAKSYREFEDLELELKTVTDSVQHTDTYISRQTECICDIMREEGFVESIDGGIGLTLLGKVAANMAEIHPLVLSKFMFDWDYFGRFTAKQLVGLFSIFTDVKVPDDMRTFRPIIDDAFLECSIKEVMNAYRKYDDIEIERNLNTGIKYESALNYDIIDFSMRWCDCETETECKEFIQSSLIDKSISIGDFTKAMLKIVTIKNEFVNICEDVGAIEFKYKLDQIEKMVLKYVTTSQSLYV